MNFEEPRLHTDYFSPCKLMPQHSSPTHTSVSLLTQTQAEEMELLLEDQPNWILEPLAKQSDAGYQASHSHGEVFLEAVSLSQVDRHPESPRDMLFILGCICTHEHQAHSRQTGQMSGSIQTLPPPQCIPVDSKADDLARGLSFSSWPFPLFPDQTS